MYLKDNIITLINNSGFENKKVVKMLDEIRKIYHNPKNIGTKVLYSKEHSKFIAKTHNNILTLSKDQKFVFHKGGWRKVYKDDEGKYFVYLKGKIYFSVKK